MTSGQPTQPARPVYEVQCLGCAVTFPIGTKRCLHCGERIGRPRFLPVAGPDGVPVFESAEGLEELEEVEVAPRRWRGMRVGITLLWLVLAAAVRVCQGEG